MLRKIPLVAAAVATCVCSVCAVLLWCSATLTHYIPAPPPADLSFFVT